MSIPTSVAVALAVVVALGFLFVGPSLFGGVPSQDTTAPVTQNDSMQTELIVTDDVVGTGTEAKNGDTLTVNYVGMLEDGTVFDQGTFTFELGAGKVIAGWDQGLVGMKEGGSRLLVIPAALGYGSQGYGPIPPNATLIFQVELVKAG